MAFRMKILFISLGCDKNLVDSEKMLGLLRREGHSFTDDEQEAEAVIINTCCFIGDAKEESVNTILEMAQLKEDGCCRVLIVTGCMAQRYQQEIFEEIPEVDGIVGTSAYEEIGAVLRKAMEDGGQVSCFQDLNKPLCSPGQDKRGQAGRVVTTGGHYAFLKIAEGCDKHCTYCIIPSLRGSYRSVPMGQLVEEARKLAGEGVRELILVAQETTLYGVDLYGKKALPDLLRQLAAISGIHWIRLQYCYPEEVTDELIAAIKEEEKVCHYLDIPIQHASDRILRQMGRRTNQASIRHTVEKLRREIPDIALRTTMISGFPGETQKDHEELLDFVEEMEFERLGVFAYSSEEDTPAASFPDPVPEDAKEARRDEVMALQQEIAFEKSQSMVGRVLDVMIEGKVADEPAYVARTYMDAPDVDGYLFVNSEETFLSGDFVRVKVTGATEYDLMGEVYHESAE